MNLYSRLIHKTKVLCKKQTNRAFVYENIASILAQNVKTLNIVLTIA